MRIATPRNTMKMINGLSVDVEEWFQVGAFEKIIAHDDWDHLASRVEDNTARLLDLFAAFHVKATFFTLGWVAQRHGRLMRRIVAEGHELASHGWDHARVFTLTADSFAKDLQRASKALEDATGVAINAYRAPSFSIDQRTPWAHAVLAEQGYAYSSSVAAVAHDHYGWREAPRFAFRPLADSAMIELPVTSVTVGSRRLAAGGGGFFRVFPYRFSHWAIARVNHHDQRPAIFYCHPWEIDPNQPRIREAPLRSRLRHYTNLARMEGKISKVLRDFAWGRIDQVAKFEKIGAPFWSAP